MEVSLDTPRSIEIDAAGSEKGFFDLFIRESAPFHARGPQSMRLTGASSFEGIRCTTQMKNPLTG